MDAVISYTNSRRPKLFLPRAALPAADGRRWPLESPRPPAPQHTFHTRTLAIPALSAAGYPVQFGLLPTLTPDIGPPLHTSHIHLSEPMI